MVIYVEFRGFIEVDDKKIITTGRMNSYCECSNCGVFHDSYYCPNCDEEG